MRTYIIPKTVTTEIQATYTLLGTSRIEINTSDKPISDQYLIV